jgi:hypothetical protein
MRHVPLLEAEMVGVEVVFESEHPVAVPPAKIEYVVAPVPDPPEGVMVNACE